MKGFHLDISVFILFSDITSEGSDITLKYMYIGISLKSKR